MSRARFLILMALGLSAIDPAAHAGADKNSAGSALSQPTDSSLTSNEQITVWGHRRHLLLAPVPNNGMVDPGAALAKPGTMRFEGGPTHTVISNGVAASLAIPVPGVKNLDFVASLGASRDQLSPAGSTPAAAATVGFRLKF